MVFCYKIITDSPRRGRSISPSVRRTSTYSVLHSSTSQLMNIVNYASNKFNEDILDAIPETDWRLLKVLAKKRRENQEREELARQFRELWMKEKEEREIVEAESAAQYHRYITRKRQKEQRRLDYIQNQKYLEEQLKQRQLIDTIIDKQQKTDELLAWIDDKKANNLLNKGIEEEARSLLAAERRNRLDEVEKRRKELQLLDMEKKVHNAGRRKKALLKQNTQRLAINNALSSWESSLVRQEVFASDALRRANYAASAALTEARALAVMRDKNAKIQRGKRLAAVTEQLRETVRCRDWI